MNIDIAKKLAQITGKPLSDFIQGVDYVEDSIVDVANKETETELAGIQDQLVYDDDEVEDNQQSRSCEFEEEYEYWTEEELLEFQKMFPGSTISDGGKIMGGPQMSRKEYLKVTRNLTRDEVLYHPLHFKMFRAEGQTEAFYFRWVDRFPEAEYEGEE